MNVLQAQKMSWREHAERGEAILKELQKTLLPEYAYKLIAINVETGEYVLGERLGETSRAFQQRFPGQVAYVLRVDGGPAIKFHDRNSL
jgi:hypothetical protein